MIKGEKKNIDNNMPRSFLVKQKMQLDEVLAKQEQENSEDEIKADVPLDENENHFSDSEEDSEHREEVQNMEENSEKLKQLEGPRYLYQVPIVYQPVPGTAASQQYYIAPPQDYWSTRFPFYVKPRTYSPDNHLEHENRPRPRELALIPEQATGIAMTANQQKSYTLDDFKSRASHELLKAETVYKREESDNTDFNFKENVVIVETDNRTQPDDNLGSYTVNVRKIAKKPKDSRQYACKFCDKDYMTLGALKMHIRTHTLPCKCQICGKAFSRPWLLQGHIRTHTGERPFACSYCGRAFADRSNLRAHIHTHADVKKLYECQKCTRTFTRMSMLAKHEVQCYKKEQKKIMPKVVV